MKKVVDISKKKHGKNIGNGVISLEGNSIFRS
jgi:hypothetical protein